MLNQLHWRYAVKKFDPTFKISAEQFSKIEQAIMLAPSSYGLQAWKFVTVADPELRIKLRAVSFNQSQITDASHLVVFARRETVTEVDVTKYIERAAELRGIPVAALADLQRMINGSLAKPVTLPGGSMETYTRSQVYIALSFGLAAAAMLGVDACPMEGITAPEYDKLLGLGEMGYKACVVATFGQRDAADFLAPLAKVRYSEAELFLRR